MSSTISSVSSSPTSSTTSSTTTSLPSASSIISSAGIGLGSTYPVSQVLAGLMTVESIPLTQLQNQVSGVQTEISAYGTLNSALSTFQTSVQQLTLPTDYEVYSATSSSSSVVTAAAVAGSTTGTYNVDVTQLAQAQTVVAAGQASESTNLATNTGNATVTFTFGTTTGTGASASFTPNSAQASGSVTINSSDDTLTGIQNAINAANVGVTASIVNTGNSTTPYQLVLTGSNTGANEGFQVAVSGDSNIASVLSYTPGSPVAGGVSQAAAAQDAALTVNGLSLKSSTNTNSSLPGIVLQLSQVGTATVTVAANTSAIETNINNFVTAYNTLQTQLSALTKYSSTGGANGPLLGDPTIQAIQSQILQTISSSLTGTGGGLSSLTQVGINLESNGSLSVDDTTLTQQIQANGSQFAGLFGTAGFATNSNVSYVTGSSTTQPGTYAIDITRAATQGTSTAGTALAASTVLASPTALTVTVNGTSANITIPAGTYTQAQLASTLQSAINTNSAIQTAGQSVNVTQTNGILTVASTEYGSTSTVDVSGAGAATLFGTVTDTAGVNVAGTIGGQPATGSGQTLTAGGTSGPGGLQVNVTGTTTGELGSVNYSLGYAAQLNTIINSATATTTGSIATATGNLTTQVTALQTQESTLQQYINQVQAQYQTEFTALDASLATLQSTATFLQETFNPTTSSS